MSERIAELRFLFHVSRMIRVRKNYKTAIYTVSSVTGHGARHYTVRTLSQMGFEQAIFTIPAVR